MIYVRLKECILHYVERHVAVLPWFFGYIERYVRRRTSKPPIKVIFVNDVEAIGFEDFTQV